MIKLLKIGLLLIVLLYPIVCILLYLLQEKLIFHPEKTPLDHAYQFEQPFEEVYLETPDKLRLHGLLFSDTANTGVIFYLHGNTGTMVEWGAIAHYYTALGQDIFMIDYRGYGKSEGEIISQQQFYDDMQMAYRWLLTRYDEDRISVVGYSVGTGVAAMLAQSNHPKRLILKAPYYSITDMTKQRFPFVPSFLLKYRFPTGRYVKRVKVPVTVFHGTDDEIIYYGSSKKISKKFKPGDRLVTLAGHGHNGFEQNEKFMAVMSAIFQKDNH